MLPSCALTSAALAQDVPGIEICTVEKTMERETSCLQSNVDFLQKTVTKLGLDHQQKLDAAKAQIEALKSTIAGLQKGVEESAGGAEEAKRAAAGERQSAGRRWCEIIGVPVPRTQRSA